MPVVTKERVMTAQYFTTSFSVDQSPSEVFEAITNVHGWWSEEIEGHNNRAGETFKYRFQDLHRREIRVDELIAGKKVAWTVVDNYFSFTEDAAEWKDTRIDFGISKKIDKTEVTFTHVGLVSAFECYDACSNGWHAYINGSLKDLITTGQGRPNRGEAITNSEKALAG
jgi:hypothetical protein